MSELIYIDTNVYLDYFQNRNDKLRPLGEFAFNLLQSSVECEYHILTSKWVLIELEKYISNKNIEDIFSWLNSNNKLSFISTTNEDLKRAKRHNHWEDALHAIIARKGNAKFFVTRNIKDFSRFCDILKIVLPENL